ncbi:hypothetical protein Hanom_Chr03g00235531 [Helianthus anomalus]
MDNLTNCNEFYSLSLLPVGRLYQKNQNRFNLLDDHVHSGVNFFSTAQEIVQDWQSMGEEIMEFEKSKQEFGAECESFNSNKKGLMWRVANAEEKLAHEKHLNADLQNDWTAACERSNRELKAVCDETIRVNAERAKESKEFDRLSAMYKEKESEVLDAQKSNEEVRARVAELGKTVKE